MIALLINTACATVILKNTTAEGRDEQWNHDTKAKYSPEMMGSQQSLWAKSGYFQGFANL